MKDTAWWSASRHPEWGAALSGFLRDQLAAQDLTAAQREELASQLAGFARATPVQGFLAERLNDASASREARRIVLRAMAQANVKEAPDGWIAGLTQVLSGGDAELVREAVATVRALRIPRPRADKLVARLHKIAGDTEEPAAVRLGALAAVPGGPGEVDGSAFDFLRSQLAPDQPVATRTLAADVLSRAKLNAEQLVALTESVKAAGPLEADRLIDAFAQSSDERVGKDLVAALKASPARASLRVEALKPRLAKFGPAVQKDAAELYAALEADAAQQRAKLEGLLAGLKDGDVRRGQAVFMSSKAACSSCHAIGYLGGKIGPDLTHIGKIRNERDLLESIVFPSASFVRSYEPVQVTTKSGKVHNGLVRKDAPDEVVLATSATEEVRIPRDDVEEVVPSKVSVMPAGLDQQLTPRELADLVAFLKACK
jgi:putative heme-binding domain-containing protein